MRFFDSQTASYKILIQLEDIGIAPFSDSKTPFLKYYVENLANVLNEDIIQSYTNHPTEGYFYFLYDSNRFSFQEAQKLILNL